MKKSLINKNLLKISLLLILPFLIMIAACDKEISEKQLQSSEPASTDATGASWKTIVIASPSSYKIPVPAATSSSEYLKEIEELKSVKSKLSASQRAAVNYWSVGAVIRWNQITRELIAKYNLPPVNNPDGTYPVPDATNPTAYPKYPFANPAYAARAYALLSVAQYDALVATWYYKFQHNRPAPYSVDNSIAPLLAKSALPSYPSEDAVIASVSLELLKFLFPGDVDYLDEKAEEHKNSKLWAGVNVKSDLVAGDSLGKLIAAKVIEYGKADGMKTAGKWSPEIAATHETDAMAGVGGAWKSQETPARPPMLPNYGTLKNWLFNDAKKIAIRPPAPPKIGSPEFEKALDELRGYSKNITRDQFRIVSFWADGVGTYTPPGHWNAITEDLIVKNKMSELRTARTYALLNMAMMDAGVCCWETKFYYYVPRPSQVDPTIKTATGLPNFPSYTSGHSTFSGSASTVLSYIFPAEAEKLQAMALEASISRVYGGIHYSFDCDTGLKCGKEIGNFAVLKGKADGSPQ